MTDLPSQPFDLLEYSSVQFDALLCLNGNLPNTKDFFDFFKEIIIIAADGAARALQQLDISPTFIIGDLDSIYLSDTNVNFPDSMIIHLPDQESNDFEKCLIFCQERGYTDVLVCGFHGGIAEHTLNNWSVLMRHSQLINLCVYEKERYAIPLQKSVQLPSNVGEIISLIPQPLAKITTSGLQWNLTNEFLELGVREGARNCALSESVSIEIHEGNILLFCNARIPKRPIFIPSNFLIS
ncbi:MAG: thiamine diphosphokinase [Bacteroidetes bacterium]|nr:thiamine diphosphokinase [Bacteroidota bacterium]